MLIYILVPTYPSLYKPYYDNQFADLVDCGHDVRVFSLGSADNGINKKVSERGLAARTSHYFPQELRSLGAFAPKLIRALVRNPIRRWKPLQAVRDSDPARARQLQHFARALTLPLNAPDLIIVHAVRTAKLFPWLKKVYPDVPVALVYHGGGLLGADPADVFGTADVVFTNTAFSVEEAVRFGCTREKLRILPVGLDPSDYQPLENRSYHHDGILRLLSVSRLAEEKGHVYAIDAVAKLVGAGYRKLHYRIVGDGPAEIRHRLQDQVRNLGIEEFVTFVGVLPAHEVKAAMAEADILLLPSFDHQGFVETQAACVQEAALMGALAVTSQIGGVPESTPPVMRPFSVPCQDSEAIADSICRLASLPVQRRREMAHEGRVWVEQRYDIRILNQRMLRETHDLAVQARANTVAAHA